MTLNSQPSTLNWLPPIIAQFPNLLPGELERWLAGAVALGGVLLLWRKLFGNGNTPVRRHDYERLSEQVTRMHAELSTRLAAVEAALARLDERTRSKTS